MKSYDSRSGVAWQREDGFNYSLTGVVFQWDCGKGGRLAGLHVYAAEVDGAAEGALDGGFQEVEFAHGDAAGGDDDVDFAKGVAEGLFKGSGSVAVSIYFEC